MSGEQSRIRAAHSLALLWAFTSVLYFLHPQGAVPLFLFLGISEKWPSVLASLAVCGGLWAFPQSRIALALAFLISSLSLLAWHSWIGAYQALVPFGFLFLFIFRGRAPGELQRALLDSLLLGLLAGALHRWNPSFLGGQEFLPGGTLFRDLPGFLLQQSWFLERPVLWSWIWILIGILPIPFLMKGSKIAWGLLLLSAAISILFYKVLFYGFFLLIPALILWDSSFLLRWRGSKPDRTIKPWYLYLVSQLGFFLWYLLARESSWILVLVIFISCGVALASSLLPESPSSPASWSSRRIFWSGGWLVFLVLPFFSYRIPAPFGLTQFSSRESRFPPSETAIHWRGYQDCNLLKRDYALRWGYRVWQEQGDCKLQLFR